jgi:methyl-accepting chemotaxis protein
VNVQTQEAEFTRSRRELIAALRKLRQGDFTVRLPEDGSSADHELATLFNEVVSLNQQMTGEFERLSHVVGKEGKIGHRAKIAGATGGWETKLHAINELIDDMVQPTVEVARVIGAVAKGDLSQAMAVEIDGRPLKGEFLRIGKVVNTMVEQLANFTSEVTRVAREVGTEGKLGGQAVVPGVGGTWKDLTDR